MNDIRAEHRGDPIRVLVADDQALVRAALATLIETQPDLAVVGQAADGRQAVLLTRELGPDIVLMDIRMPGLDGPPDRVQMVVYGYEHGLVEPGSQPGHEPP